MATITAFEPRGYTGHEHLDDIGIIHMNGRIYDPRLGRMLSPDPVTQAPESGQNYNRYTYAYNNPLMYTDPSGFETHKKSVLVDGNGNAGAGPMEHVPVTAPRLTGGVTGNQAALTHAGGGGNNSPQREAGDVVGQAGQPVEDIQTAGGIDCRVADCTSAELNEPELSLGSNPLVEFILNYVPTNSEEVSKLLSQISILSAGLSLPAIATGQVQLYGTLQFVSFSSGFFATWLNPIETTIAGTVVDSASAYLVYNLGVTSTPFGRFTLLTFETGSAVSTFLFYEVSENETKND
ncbi:MAG: RHS repeat-associated core domain-containing protein [Pseudomonadales bacterium]|nr:RHS repeat-associated core domain-containing protein [Pseudomonadales bacterium]